MKGKIILKEASILLIIASLMLSGLVVSANTIGVQNNIQPTSRGELLYEGFEDNLMPPTGGWYNISFNPTSAWGIVDNLDYVHDGSYAGWIQWDVGDADEWLTTPDIDLTAEPDATLVFFAQSNTLWPTATMQVIIRGSGIDDTIWDMIVDETWEEFIYRKVTLDLTPYVGNIINVTWRYVGYDGQSFGLDDVFIFSGAGPQPDLDCTGSLSFVDVKAGEVVNGTFTVENIGDFGSTLDWEVSEYPDWGTFEFDPIGGVELYSEDDAVVVVVNITAPDQQNEEFTGEITIVNSADPSDSCIIDISLATPQNQPTFIELLVSRILERFPLLEQILMNLL